MATATVLHTGAVGLDLTDFASFAKDLRKAEPALAKGLAVRLRAAGAIVAEEAKTIASEVSANKVPATIKVRVSSATISVVAGKGVPLAALLELGNVRKRDSGTFRHPIWGHWVTDKGIQNMHPFLVPAVERKAEAVYQAVINVLDETIATATRGV